MTDRQKQILAAIGANGGLGLTQKKIGAALGISVAWIVERSLRTLVGEGLVSMRDGRFRLTDVGFQAWRHGPKGTRMAREARLTKELESAQAEATALKERVHYLESELYEAENRASQVEIEYAELRSNPEVEAVEALNRVCAAFGHGSKMPISKLEELVEDHRCAVFCAHETLFAKGTGARHALALSLYKLGLLTLQEVIAVREGKRRKGRARR